VSHVKKKETAVMTETIKYTGAEMSRLASRERLTMITTMRGLLRIEVHPRRRWKWWGTRGWLVVLHLLYEQDDTWSCRKFFTRFADLCTQLGIDEDDPVWQDKTQPSIARPRIADRAEKSGWIPFCMF
jgi:hypothetical protein